MKSSLEIVKEACTKANPEIMELKSDCLFKWNYDIWKVNCKKCDAGRTYAFSCSGDKHSWPAEMGARDNWDYKYRYFNAEEIGEAEILGRPITLADVLLAIERVEDMEGKKILYRLIGFSEPEIRWNLHKDSLDQQSQRTLDFLATLLSPTH